MSTLTWTAHLGFEHYVTQTDTGEPTDIEMQYKKDCAEKIQLGQAAHVDQIDRWAINLREQYSAKVQYRKARRIANLIPVELNVLTRFLSIPDTLSELEDYLKRLESVIQDDTRIRNIQRRVSDTQACIKNCPAPGHEFFCTLLHNITRNPNMTLDGYDRLFPSVLYTIDNVELYCEEYNVELLIDWIEIEIPLMMVDTGSITSQIVCRFPDDAISIRGYHHPHVDQEGRPCLGPEGNSLVEDAFEELRYSDIAFIVESVLRTYNRREAYPAAVLHYLTGDLRECESCGAIINESEDPDYDQNYACECADCGAEMCDQCRNVCESCGELYCQEHYDATTGICMTCFEDQYGPCPNCGTYWRHDDMVECVGCDNFVCPDCVEYISERTGDHYCRECMSRRSVCEECGDPVESSYDCMECGKCLCEHCVEHHLPDYPKLCSECHALIETQEDTEGGNDA